MKEHTLKHIEELLCDELDKFGQKQSISSGDLQYIDVVLHAMKNLHKVKESTEGEGSYGYNRSGGNSYYSRRDSSYSMQDGSYGDGSYDDGSYRRGRDRMGRFVSRSGGDMVSRLKDMMNETDDPAEKRELREFIANVEHRA